LSRRAWTTWLVPATRADRFAGPGPNLWEFDEARCDPENEINRIENEAAGILNKRREESASIGSARQSFADT
jgi:hypothetical protein